MPPLMHNHGNYIVSLSNLCKWLATQAEALGVEIYPGFPAAALVIENGVVKGVTTGDLGVAKDGHHKADFTPGMNLLGKYTLFAEGARGSLTKQLLKIFNLSDGRDYQKFGIGVKELWELPPDKHKRGLVVHTVGWPLSNDTGGGLFCYHWGENFCSIGFVVHLNYSNPFLSPFDEMQRVKQHPRIRELLEGGKRLVYGARAVTEGGFQSVPKLAFPGGALIGCAAGFMNLPRIKGSHNAVKTGMLAAEGGWRRGAGGGRGRHGRGLRGGLSRPEPCLQGPEAGTELQAAVVEAGHAGRLAVHGAGSVDQPALRILVLRHAEARQAGLRDAEAGRGVQKDRLSQAGRRYQFRQTFVGILVQYQPRGRPAGSPEVDRPVDPHPRQPSRV